MPDMSSRPYKRFHGQLFALAQIHGGAFRQRVFALYRDDIRKLHVFKDDEGSHRLCGARNGQARVGVFSYRKRWLRESYNTALRAETSSERAAGTPALIIKKTRKKVSAVRWFLATTGIPPPRHFIREDAQTEPVCRPEISKCNFPGKYTII